jgi:hypothetical protein
MAKKKDWRDKLDAEAAAESPKQRDTLLAHEIEKDLFKDGVPVALPFPGPEAPKPKPYSMVQIEVMTLQRELHLAKAEILELKLKSAGITF